MNMKMGRIAILVILTALVFASCAGLAPMVVSQGFSAVSSGSSNVAAAPAAVADFQSGEILCSADANSMADSGYYVAKIISPASPATKNQAQVVFISDGSKSWVNYAVNSRKATKADFAIGATLFYLNGYQGYDKIDADSYRKSEWLLGTITSVESLYKNNVEVGGYLYNIQYLRVPTDPLK
jgi:hypothetical protein